MVLAEELLDETPDDLDALLIIADAAPRYGHGEVGALAAAQAARRGAEIGALEAAALLSACEVEAALDAAEATLLRRPDDARAHAVRGQALELLGRSIEGAAALARAAALSPERYPLPIAVTPAEWDALLVSASTDLPRELRDALRGVDLDLADLPDLALLQALSPPPSPLVHALVADPDARRPRLQLFRRNLLRGAESVAELEERVRAALHAELEHLLTEPGR